MKSALSDFSVRPMDFTLGGCVAEEQRELSVECEVVWMSGSPAATPEAEQSARSERVVLNGHCSSENEGPLF